MINNAWQKIIFTGFTVIMKLHNTPNFLNTVKKIAPIEDLKLFDEDLKVFKNLSALEKDSFEYRKSMLEESLNQYLEEKKNIFLNCIPEKNRKIGSKFMDLAGYNEFLIPHLGKPKPAELEYLYSVASRKDMLGELRIPANYFPAFSQKIKMEGLKQLEPMLFSKNIFGQWSYEPEFFLGLSKYTQKQIELINKLASCKVEPESAIHIAEHQNLNSEKIIEKAESLNKIYSKNLREIRFFTNRLGENYLCAELQLPPSSVKPSALNYEEVFSRIDEDVNPIERQNLKADIDDLVENIYSKISKNVCKFSEKDLDKIISNLVNGIPNTKESEVLTVIQKLTQFANYSSITPLAENLKAHNIGMIGSYGELGPIFQYFHKYKNLLELSEAPVQNGAFFVTKKDIQNPEYIAFLKKVKDSPDLDRIKFINLEGWSNGVNLLGDDTKLEKSAKRVILNAKKIAKQNPDLTFEECVSKVLNWELEKRFDILGLDLTTIRLSKPVGKQSILEQMQPVIPSKNIVASTIETVAKSFTNSKQDFKDLSKAIAMYYDETINIYSKQKIIESLKLLDCKINQFLAQNNLSRDDLYFISPELEGQRKSFDVINKMYQDLFNIPDERFIKIQDLGDLQDYSSKSTFVILDDVVGSGESMVQVGEYDISADVYLEDKHILFAPITASDNGIKHIQKVISDMSRENNDFVITLNENMINSKSVKLNAINDYFHSTKFGENALGEEGYKMSSQCTVFPYMSPDNNSELSTYLTSFFLPNLGGLKNKTLNASEIKEMIYVHDVFGTVKENLLKDHIRVYSPTVSKQNPVKEFLKKLFSGKGFNRKNNIT